MSRSCLFPAGEAAQRSLMGMLATGDPGLRPLDAPDAPALGGDLCGQLAPMNRARGTRRVLRLPSSRCAFTGGRLSGSLAFQTCLQLLALHLHWVLQPLDLVAGEGVEVQGSDRGWLPAVLTPSVHPRWCCVSANPQGWAGEGRRGQAAAGRLGGCATQELPRDAEGLQVSEGSPQPLLWPNRAPEAKTSHGDPALASRRPCWPAARCDVLAPGLATVPNRSAQQGPREEAPLPLEQWFDIFSLTGWESVAAFGDGAWCCGSGFGRVPCEGQLRLTCPAPQR